jgi:hypothetical protein
MMAARRAAVQRFGVSALSAGEPVSNLRRKFVPIWLLHRYPVEAAAKPLGGVDFAYSVRGDGREASAIVPENEQRRALEVLLATLNPSELEVPSGLLPICRPGGPGTATARTTSSYSAPPEAPYSTRWSPAKSPLR